MKKTAIIVGVLFICGLAWGQQDGSLAGYQGGAPSDLILAGPGGIIGHDISLVFGSISPDHGPYVPQGWGYSFQTGYRTDNGIFHGYTEGASFGEGGAFDAYNKSADWCASGCHFRGTFVWARLTQTTLSDGTYIYSLAGELTGTYTTDIGQADCRAYVTLPLFDESTPIFEGMTSISYGGLQIIYHPN